jgi:hypothetical protein
MLQDIAPHSFHNEFKVPPPPPSGGDSAVLFHEGAVLLTGEGGFTTVAEVLALGAEEEKLIYLFSVDDRRFYLLE